MKKPHFALSTLSAACLAITSYSALADDHAEFRQHQAHVHGSVTFSIVQDGKDVLIEVESPGQDVLGFEHSPQSNEEQKTYQQARSLLANADQLFTLSTGADCQLMNVQVEDNIAIDKHSDHDEHDEHDHDDHKHEHDDHKHEHDDHKHDDDEHEDHDEHGTFNLQYQYECSDIAKLSQINTQWFKHFPATENIDVNLLTDAEQKHLELKANNIQISW